MKKSIGVSIIILNIITVIICYVGMVFALTGGFELDVVFSSTNIVTLCVLILVSIVISGIISKSIVFPLKKIEKGMRAISEGKILDMKHLNKYTKLIEIENLVDAYVQMIQIIKKNNFDLNSQQSKTEIILEHMADGVVAFSISRQVVHMNKAAMRLLGIDSTYETFDKILGSLNLKLEFDKIIYLPNYKSIETKITVDGNALNIVFVPFFSDRLNPMGVIMIVRNITETVKLDNLRKEFVANVSHELKTPLTSIKGYSETIINGDLTYQEIIRFSKVINQEANRMDRLVVDLLQLSRFDYQKVSWKKMMFSIEDMAKNVCEKMRYLASEKKHKLECVVTASPPNVYADKDAIEQVIMNIVSNSIKYTKEGGEIKIYVGSINKGAYIKVVDNGMGIPKKDLSRIFERFYRVDKARSREMGGTGLGLAIVKEIVDGNNGTIDIKSDVGKGTEVIITLPTKIKVI